MHCAEVHWWEGLLGSSHDDPLDWGWVKRTMFSTVFEPVENKVLQAVLRVHKHLCQLSKCARCNHPQPLCVGHYYATVTGAESKFRGHSKTEQLHSKATQPALPELGLLFWLTAKSHNIVLYGPPRPAFLIQGQVLLGPCLHLSVTQVYSIDVSTKYEPSL